MSSILTWELNAVHETLQHHKDNNVTNQVAIFIDSKEAIQAISHHDAKSVMVCGTQKPIHQYHLKEMKSNFNGILHILV